MDDITKIVTLSLGALIIGTLCFVFFRDKKLHLSGIAFSVIGFILVGLPYWKTIEFSINSDGINTKVEQALKIASEAEAKAIKTEAKVKVAEAELLKTQTLVQQTVNASLAIKNTVETIRAQEKLRSKRLYAGEIDGRFSNKTRSSLIKFQASAGLPKTGELDTKTLDALKIKPIQNFPKFEGLI